MRHAARLLLALVVAAPGPSWGQTISAAARAGVSSVPVLPVTGISLPVGALNVTPLSLPTLSALTPLPILPAAAVTPAAKAVFSAAAENPGEDKSTKKDLEGQKQESDAAFDGASALGAVANSLGRVRTDPPENAGHDGGGPNYPKRKVEFNGVEFPSVAFRPNEPVEPLLVKAIESARESIDLALYEFTSRGLLKALLAARKRGVKIRILLDDTSANPRNEPDAEYKRHRSEQIWALIRADMDVNVVGRPTKYGIMHHKFAVFDGKMAEFGSYNWTYTSERNHYENVIFSADKDRVAGYQAAWNHLQRLSVPIAESANHAWPEEIPAPPADEGKPIAFNGAKLPRWVFTPSDAYEDALAAAIDASKKTVDAAAFVFESRKIADAMDRALERGVKVRIVSDKSQSEHENVKRFLDWASRKGADVRVLFGPNGEDSDFPLAEKMHNKFFIFDGKLVETGSANATKNAAVNNFENANFLDDKSDAKAFVFAYEHMFAAATPLGGVAEMDLPTDEILRRGALTPRGPPAPPEPGPDPLPASKTVEFAGETFPYSAVRPNEPVDPQIVKMIGAAKKTLKLALYEFNHEAIFEAVKQAKARGVAITIVLDRSHVYTSGYEDDGETPRKPKAMIVELLKSGYDVLLLKGRNGGIMHNKFIVADEGIVQFGSFNYTRQSEEDHYENVFFTTEKERVGAYSRYFDYMRGLAEEPDMEKLEEIMARTEAVLDEEDAEAGDVEPEGARKPLPPDPPQDTDAPIRLHDEAFPRQLFSPNGGVETALLRAIEAAKASVEVAMFSFFSQPIAEALLRAKERGVAVRIVMDKSQTGNSKLDEWFAWHGFDLRVLRGPDDDRDPRYQKMHNKFALFDGVMLESGSFNYSSRAETLSFENANFFNDPNEVARFAAYFAQMFARGMTPKKPKREPQWIVPKSDS